MDTHRMFSELRKEGFSETHSEAITKVMRDARSSCEFAIKNDLQDIRYEMKCLEQRMTIKASVLGVAIFIISMINNRF